MTTNDCLEAFELPGEGIFELPGDTTMIPPPIPISSTSKSGIELNGMDASYPSKRPLKANQ
jgi:hypothetical protein